MDTLDNQRLRKKSGEITSNDPLVGFLYDLLRDHLPAATVEELVRTQSSKETKFSNGWLATYAEDLAARLRSTPTQYQEVVERTHKTEQDLADLAVLKTQLADIERSEIHTQLTTTTSPPEPMQYELPSFFQTSHQPTQTQASRSHSRFGAGLSNLFAKGNSHS